MCDPQYQDSDADQIIKAHGEGVKVTIIAGSSFGQTARTVTRTPTYYLDVELQPRVVFDQEIPDGWNGYVYVINGSIMINGTNVNRFQAGVLTQNGNLRVESENGAKFVLLAGRPLNEPIVQHGPMVMNTREEIEQAFSDYRNQRNGFEGALTWESKIKNQ